MTSNRTARRSLTTSDAEALLQVSESHFCKIAEGEGLKSSKGRWSIGDVKRVALLLLVIGSPVEQNAARQALTELRQARKPN